MNFACTPVIQAKENVEEVPIGDDEIKDCGQHMFGQGKGLSLAKKDGVMGNKGNVT